MITPTNISRYRVGGYDIVEGWTLNSCFGVTHALDSTDWPFLLIHLPSGAGLVWCGSLSVAERLVENLMLHSSGLEWDEQNPIEMYKYFYDNFLHILKTYAGELFWAI